MRPTLKEILSDGDKRAALENRLLQYPGVTEDEVDSIIFDYERRVEKKEGLLRRRYSNALAEIAMDRMGWPRPPGWHSVFFYPDSNRLRNGYVVLLPIFVIGSLYRFL